MLVESKSHRFMSLLPRLLLASLLIVTCLSIVTTESRLAADERRVVEGFEGIEPSWSIRADQSYFAIESHIRTNTEKKSGSQSEQIFFKTGRDSNVQLVHTIKQAQVIRDFCPSVWVKANQDHLKFKVRVVLPNTVNPVGPGPLKILVDADQSESVGKWEWLGCTKGSLVKQLNAKIRNIQFQFKDLKIETTDAFCDLIVLTGFNDRNKDYKLWIDDIAIEGFLPARSQYQNVEEVEVRPTSQSSVELKESTLSVNHRPFFVRGIKYNGEAFSFLKSLGFNTVVLSRLPTVAELDQAQQYQLWIICTPILSESPAVQSLLQSRNLEMVLAWDFGSDLTLNDLERAKELAAATERLATRLDRPTFCHAHFPIDQFAKVVDFQRWKQATFGTSFSPQHFGQYIQSEQPLGKPFLVDIQTSLPVAIGQQAACLPNSDPFRLLDKDQIEEQLFQAIFSGARGVIFDSSQNLQQQNPQCDWLVPILKLTNRRLIQVDPWIAGGTAERHPEAASSAISLNLPRSQMTYAKIVPVVSPRRRIRTLELDANQQSPRVYQINEIGISPTNHQTKTGKLKIELDPTQRFGRFVVSEDSLSFRYIYQCTHSFNVDGGILRDKFTVLRNSFRRIQFIVEELAKHKNNSPSTFVSLNELKNSLDVIETFLSKKQSATAQTLISQLDHRLFQLRTSIQQELLASRKLVSSPFNSDFSQLINYVTLERLIKSSQWSRNRLPSGTFQTLGALAKSGWTQHLNDSSEIQSHVTLVAAEKISGFDQLADQKALQIQTWNSLERQRPIEVTPVWLSSPKIKVARGHVIRVDGYIKIDQPIQSSRDGFMIIDPIGGPDLAKRFYKTDSWQYFAIERIVPQDSEFGLVFAQTGLGQVQLSNLQIRVCQLTADLAQGKADKSVR